MNLLSWPHDTYAAKCHYTWRSRGRAVARARCRVTGASIDRPTARPRPLPAGRGHHREAPAPDHHPFPRGREVLAYGPRGGAWGDTHPTPGLLIPHGGTPPARRAPGL